MDGMGSGRFSGCVYGAMGLSLCLSADRYRETFRMAYQTKEIQAREELRTLEQVLAEEPDADDAFRERFFPVSAGDVLRLRQQVPADLRRGL